MYFKIDPLSKLFADFQQLHKRMQIAEKAAADVCADVKAIGYRPLHGPLAGGISCFYFEHNQPTFPAKERQPHLASTGFFPRTCKANLALLNRLQALPKVDTKELTDLVTFKRVIVRQNKVIFHPGYYITTKTVLIHIPADAMRNYKPVPGMVEIMASEYITLSSADSPETSKTAII